MARRVPVDAFMTRTSPADDGYDLFSEPEQTGLATAWTNADDYWRSVALTGLRALAASGREFDAYDVAELGVPEPDHKNRWGALFRAAHQQGLIKPVGYHESKRPGRSGGSCRVWKGDS